MSAVHVWSCGECDALVRATVGTILQIFAAHAQQCPALRRPRPAVARRRGGALRRAPRVGTADRPRPNPA